MILVYLLVVAVVKDLSLVVVVLEQEVVVLEEFPQLVA